MSLMARSCMQSLLKVVSSIIGMVGIALILYALWMFRVIYATLGLGITLSIVTCLGNIAAETANGCCLYIYMVFVFLLLMIEAAVTVDIFLNKNWEEDFPVDTTGNFDELRHFVKDNFEICKWIGFSVVTVQGLTILLAMILKALGPHQERYYYEIPLLKNYVPLTSYVVGDPMYGPKNDAWNIRINSKASR
ncbi:unnamed protein product [Withania somnifera]